MSSRGDQLYRKLLDKYYLRYNSQFVSKLWSLTMGKVAAMTENDESTKKLATTIQRFVEKNKEKSKKKPYYDELMELYILFMIETDSLELGKADTIAVLDSGLRTVIYDEIVFDKVWSKYVDTYKFFQGLKNPYNRAIVRGYFNIFGAGDFVFEWPENIIFPPEPVYRYAYNKRKREPSDDGDGYGSTRVRYGRGSGGGGSGRGSTRVRYGRGDDGSGGGGRGSTKTKAKTTLRY